MHHKSNVFHIYRVTKDNYHLFDDIVYYRLNGKERTPDEKEIAKNCDYSFAYKELNYENFYVYAAYLDNKFVAWISIIYIPKIGKNLGGQIYIDELYTMPDYRNRGIAYALLQKAREYYNKKGAYIFRLYVATDNMPAQHVYKKIGLKDKGYAIHMEIKEEDNKK